MRTDGLPANLDAERFVLGAILVAPNQWPLAAGILGPDHFDSEEHRKIWLALSEQSNSGERIDSVTLADKLNRMGNLQAVGGLGAIVGLTDGLPQIFDIEQYARIVRRCYELRRIVYACADISLRAGRGDEEPDVIAAEAESKLRGITTRNGESEMRGVSEWMETNRDEILDPSSARSRLNLIQTGFPTLDKIYDGFAPGKLVTVAARPSVGKSAFAAQVTMRAALEGHATSFFTLEMDPPAIIARLACGLASVNAWAHRHGRLKQDDRTAYANAVMQLAQVPFFIQDTPSLSISGIRAAIARQHARGIHPRIVTIDYLQLIQMDGGNNRNEAIGETTRALKRSAREWDACVVLLSQLNRKSEYDNTRPTLANLKESGSIEEDSNDVLLLHRDNGKVSDRRIPHPIEIIVAKQRAGMVAGVELTFEPGYVRFSDTGPQQD